MKPKIIEYEGNDGTSWKIIHNPAYDDVSLGPTITHNTKLAIMDFANNEPVETEAASNIRQSNIVEAIDKVFESKLKFFGLLREAEDALKRSLDRALAAYGELPPDLEKLKKQLNYENSR